MPYAPVGSKGIKEGEEGGGGDEEHKLHIPSVLLLRACIT
jgi:hypothetical protein